MFNVWLLFFGLLYCFWSMKGWGRCGQQDHNLPAHYIGATKEQLRSNWAATPGCSHYNCSRLPTGHVISLSLHLKTRGIWNRLIFLGVLFPTILHASPYGNMNMFKFYSPLGIKENVSRETGGNGTVVTPLVHYDINIERIMIHITKISGKDTNRVIHANWIVNTRWSH